MVICVLRRFIKNDKINAPIAGFLAGLMSRVDVKTRRQFLSIILVSRAIDCIWNLLEDRKYVKTIPNYGQVLVFVLAAIP